MTQRKIESGNDTALATTGAAGAAWQVGPGRPPIEHRFQKGQSGNPAGRPRRSGAPGDRLRGADEPTRQMILEEAYRTVEVQDGETVTSLPMNRAIFRAMGAAALAGNQTAQRRWAALVQTAEAEQKRAQLALYNVIERDEKERAERQREWEEDEDGDDDPYAEEIIIDKRSGTVVIRDVGDGD